MCIEYSDTYKITRCALLPCARPTCCAAPPASSTGASTAHEENGKWWRRPAAEAPRHLKAVFLQLHIVFRSGLAVRDGQRYCRGQERPKAMAHRPAAQLGGFEMYAKFQWTSDDTTATQMLGRDTNREQHAFAAAALGAGGMAAAGDALGHLPGAAVRANIRESHPQQRKARQRDVLCRRHMHDAASRRPPAAVAPSCGWTPSTPEGARCLHEGAGHLGLGIALFQLLQHMLARGLQVSAVQKHRQRRCEEEVPNKTMVETSNQILQIPDCSAAAPADGCCAYH